MKKFLDKLKSDKKQQLLLVVVGGAALFFAGIQIGKALEERQVINEREAKIQAINEREAKMMEKIFNSDSDSLSPFLD